jgi:histidine phosphotransfer protein HptB
MTENIIDQASFETLKGMMGADFLPTLIDAYFVDAADLFRTMQEALDVGDCTRFSRAAHSLKGNSATFGAMKLAEQARKCEFMGKAGNLEGADQKLEALLVEYQQVQTALEGLRDAL